MEDVAKSSPDLVEENVDRLRELFPEIVADGRVDFEALRGLLGDEVEDTDEKFGLNWHGKRQARQLALTPSTGTLRPAAEDSVDWETTQHLMIEGDNLEVLRLLQKSYSGRVKLIYIDPPYNADGDVVYEDHFSDSIERYLAVTGQTLEAERISTNTESSGRFHTNWLNMMYPRLKLARDCLMDDGAIFISIDDRELPHLRVICNEIFGEGNLIGTIVWKNATDNNPTNIATEHEYVVVVAKDKAALEPVWKSELSDLKEVLIEVGSRLVDSFSGDALQDAYSKWFREHKSELGPLDRYKYIDEGGVFTGSQSVHNPGREGYRYDVLHPVTGQPCKQPLMGYRFPEETMNDLLSRGRVLFGEDEAKIIELKLYAHEFQEKLSSVFDLDGRLGAYDLKEDFGTDSRVFKNPKPVRLLNRFFPLVAASDTGAIVIDFFAGSGTSAKAIYDLNARDDGNRRFILVQLPEPLDPENKDQKVAAEFCDRIGKPRTIAELTKERLRRAADKIREEHPDYEGDLGFRVFKLDSSNIRAWDPQPENLEDTLLDHVDHLKENRSEQDVLYELLLKLGLDLCVPIETNTIADKTVHSIGAGTLFACLDETIEAAKAEDLALGIVDWRNQLDPAGDTTVVFRDSAFPDDVTKTNLDAILKQHNITTVRSI